MQEEIITFRVGDAPHVITATIHHDIQAPSLSGVYATLHVPKSENPSKAGVIVTPSTAAVHIELIYDRADQTTVLEIDLSSGANAQPYTTTVDVGGTTQVVDGTTGTRSSISAPLS